MTQLHWLLSDYVEDLKPISQGQNHTRSQCNPQTSCSDHFATKHVYDGRTAWRSDIGLQTDILNYDSKDRSSIAASRGKKRL